MTYSREKEYIRKAFMDGHLDVTGGVDEVRRFVEIMAGEMEALIAIDQCMFLTPTETEQLLAIAKVNHDSAREYAGWAGARSQRPTEG